MLKREFKVNLKSFIIWTTILIVLFLMVYLIYPYFITNEQVESLDDMMKGFPPELLKTFNMDISSISTAYGWVKSEGFMFVLLIVGFYSSLLGSQILLKEENDMTIEYLQSIPVKRSSIITNKIIVGFTYIISMVILLGIFNDIALRIIGDFEEKQLILLSITPIFIGLPFFALNLLISTFFHKTKNSLGISLGLVFLFYFINVLGEISDKVAFLKYFSIYTLADTRNVITNIEINPVMVIISIFITVLLISATYLRYQNKELV